MYGNKTDGDHNDQAEHRYCEVTTQRDLMRHSSTGSIRLWSSLTLSPRVFVALVRLPPV